MMEKNPVSGNTAKPGPAKNRWLPVVSPRNMSLQLRLTLLILVVSIPLLLISNLAMASRAEEYLRQTADLELERMNIGMADKTEVWLTQNVNVLRQLALLPQMISMNPDHQKILLRNTSQAFDQMYLVHTLDTRGMNVARSDDQPNTDYSDRAYINRALLGESVAFQVVIGRTTGRPALVAAAPIWEGSGSIVGAVAFASDLGALSTGMLAHSSGEEGQLVTYLVDAENHVIAHTDNELANQLTDYTSYPAVAAMRQGTRGFYNFTGADGVSYRAYVYELSNGWGVVTQANLAAVNYRVTLFRLMAVTTSLLAAALMVGGSMLMIRRAFKPVHSLITIVNKVSQGDLTQEAPVERNDEIGELSKAFNLMTERLRGTVGTLEQNVAERTRMIETSFEVSRRLSTILNLNDLVREVVEQLQQAFDYYHVHIYLFDETRQNLVMTGGTGEAGRAMLARGHRIARGKGLVGRVAEANHPILVSDTRTDSTWLPNPLLPDTQSEIAVPISISDHVIGVLDVQQNRTGGLKQLDAELLQSIANQVAIAVRNANSYAQVQERAEREVSVAAIQQKIQQLNTVDEVMEVAVSELGKLLNARHTAGEIRARRAMDSKN